SGTRSRSGVNTASCTASEAKTSMSPRNRSSASSESRAPRAHAIIRPTTRANPMIISACRPLVAREAAQHLYQLRIAGEFRGEAVDDVGVDVRCAARHRYLVERGAHARADRLQLLLIGHADQRPQPVLAQLLDHVAGPKQHPQTPGRVRYHAPGGKLAGGHAHVLEDAQLDDHRADLGDGRVRTLV